MRKRLVTMGIGLGLVLSPTFSAPASADHSTVEFCRQLAAENPDIFEQFVGSHGACVRVFRFSQHWAHLCRDEQTVLFFEEFYGVEFANPGDCVSFFNQLYKSGNSHGEDPA
jgi:hypothetical protein